MKDEIFIRVHQKAMEMTVNGAHSKGIFSQALLARWYDPTRSVKEAFLFRNKKYVLSIRRAR